MTQDLFTTSLYSRLSRLLESVVPADVDIYPDVLIQAYATVRYTQIPSSERPASAPYPYFAMDTCSDDYASFVSVISRFNVASLILSTVPSFVGDPLLLVRYLDEVPPSFAFDVSAGGSRIREYRSAVDSELDLVIVADRFLTGFDAPCISSIFLDRQPMSYHMLIQAFSRTNRVFDKNKTKGYIVTFQAPDTYRNSIDTAIRIFTNGGTDDVVVPPFTVAEEELRDTIRKLRVIAPTPEDCASFTPTDKKSKKLFCYAFQRLDNALDRVRTYMEWNDRDLERDYGLSWDAYDKYLSWYRNFMDERSGGDEGDDPVDTPDDGPEPDGDYVLLCQGKENIDYVYIVNLIRQYVDTGHDSVGKDIEDSIAKLREASPKLGDELNKLWQQVKIDPAAYKNVDLLALFERMKKETVDCAIRALSEEYCLSYDVVLYASHFYRGGEQEDIPCFDQIRKTWDPMAYNNKKGMILTPLRYSRIVRTEIKRVFDEYVIPLKSF